MNCSEAKRLISDRLDDALPQAHDGKLHAHLDSCPDCRIDMEMMGLLKDLLAQSDRIEPTPGFSLRIVERIRQQAAVTIWAQLDEAARRLIPALALLLAIFAALFPLASGQPGPQGESYGPLLLSAEIEEPLLAERTELTSDRVLRTIIEENGQ